MCAAYIYTQIQTKRNLCALDSYTFFQTATANKSSNPLRFHTCRVNSSNFGTNSERSRVLKLMPFRVKKTQKRQVTYPQALMQVTVHRKNLQLKGEQINTLPHEKSLL